MGVVPQPAPITVHGAFAGSSEIAKAVSTPEQPANAAFAFIEGLYTPRRRHSTLGYPSPAETQTPTGLGRHTETAA